MSRNLYLMKLCPDEIVHKCASDMKSYHSVPAGRRFVSKSKDKEKKDRKWTELVAGCLDQITINDRLVVVGHGDEDRITGETESWDAGDFAKGLKKWGLKEVGYIKFLCCDLGRGTFLDDFVKAAVLDQGIKVGMVQGYRGLAWTILGPRKMLVATGDKHWLKTGDKRVKRVSGTFQQNAAQMDMIDSLEERGL